MPPRTCAALGCPRPRVGSDLNVDGLCLDDLCLDDLILDDWPRDLGRSPASQAATRALADREGLGRAPPSRSMSAASPRFAFGRLLAAGRFIPCLYCRQGPREAG